MAESNLEPTAFITGGSHGIGRAIADRLLADGWRVAVLDIVDPDSPMDGLHIRGDAACEADVKAAIDRTLDTFGHMDGLVNNVGIGTNKPISELALEEWNRVLAVNLTSVFLCAKQAEPFLRQTKGSIVNVSSTRAFQSEANTEAYSASKGGVVALTHALAVSLGPDIRVNCISPGWIETRPDASHSAEDRAQHPCGRVGIPNDIAEMAAYLLSKKAGFITGQNFTIDGGMTKKMIYV